LPEDNTMTLQEAKSIARHLGCTLRQVRSDAYRVNLRDGNETTAYYADNLEDAVNTAVEMARTPQRHGGGRRDPGAQTGAELGGLLKEYVAESNHNSWDCWQRRDLTSIRRLFEDIMRYHSGAGINSDFATKQTTP
jgi:hypothetical protein